jgi:hypothetical protein
MPLVRVVSVDFRPTKSDVGGKWAIVGQMRVIGVRRDMVKGR